ncbi:hypothetical protein PV328_005556 [Microctonus aethiopoides]|uniref:Uncharacterized protein n=1 Tax=Microctonus aethiopoides TaxID=144406 RepID=A0AA39KSL0_9HYME|nr:hypothetical protein PV328_005556 [Microctonus aethiopoides]
MVSQKCCTEKELHMGVYGSQDSILDLTNERDPWLFNPSTRAPSGVLEDAVAVIESTVSRAVEAEVKME